MEDFFEMDDFNEDTDYGREVREEEETVAGDPFSVYEETRGGYTLTVRKDEGAESPRLDREYNSHMICFDVEYNGDPHHYIDEEDLFSELAEDEGLKKHASVEDLKEAYVILPIYKDADGVFSAEPGEGVHIGWIYMDRDTVEFALGEWSEDVRKSLENSLKHELQTYTDYYRGDNYVYDIRDRKTGENIDGGYYTGPLEKLPDFAWRDLELVRNEEVTR